VQPPPRPRRCESNDGFDAGIVQIDKTRGVMVFAGARTNPVIPNSNEFVVRLVADKQV
jgi:hypothetical protein